MSATAATLSVRAGWTVKALVGAAENKSRGSGKGGDFGEGGEVSGGGTRLALRHAHIFRESKGKGEGFFPKRFKSSTEILLCISFNMFTPLHQLLLNI